MKTTKNKMQCYINYLDCKNNYQKTKKDFKDFKSAFKFMCKTFDNPNIDFINYY